MAPSHGAQCRSPINYYTSSVSIAFEPCLSSPNNIRIDVKFDVKYQQIEVDDVVLDYAYSILYSNCHA